MNNCRLGKARVLIVDDELDNRKLLEAFLSQDDCLIHTASGGQEALDIIGSTPIDLVLLDIMMPDMGGFEVCQRLKANVKTANIPVIFITGRDDPQSIIHGFEIGAYDFFVKPIKQAEVQVKINNCLRLSCAEREFRRERDRRMKTENIIQFISKETSAVTGIDFFQSLLQHTSRTLGFERVILAEFNPNNQKEFHTLIVCEKGQMINNYSYSQVNTPSEEVVQKRLLVVADGVRDLYPGGEELFLYETRSYAGTLLTGKKGVPLGILVMMSKAPCNEPDFIESVLGAISVRASSELQRMRDAKHLVLTNARFDLAISANDAGVYELRVPLQEPVYFSSRLSGIMGLEPDQLPPLEKFPQWLDTRLHPDEIAVLHKKYLTFIIGPRKKIVVRHRLLHQDGHWVHVQNYAIGAEWNAQGRLIRLVGVVVDQTAEYQNEQAILRESTVNRALTELSASLIDPQKTIQDIYDITLEYALDITGALAGLVMVIESGTREGLIVSASGKGLCSDEAIRAMHRISVSEYGKYPGLIGQALNTQTGFYTNRASLRPGIGKGLSQEHKEIKRFLAVPAMLGGRLVGQICLANPERDFNENDLKVATQLTELFSLAVSRKEMEDALKASEEHFKIMFDLAPDAYFLHDSEGRIVDGNRVAQELIGYSREEIVGKRIYSFMGFTKENLKALEKFNRLSIQKRSVSPLQLGLTLKGGKVFLEIRTHTVKIYDQVLVLGIARDITHRKKMERRIMEAIMETEEKERRRFAQDLHDGLGPLLSTAKLYIRSLETMEDPENRAYAYLKSMEVINQSIISLKEIANNISPHVLTNFGLISALRKFIMQVLGTSSVEISLDTNLDVRLVEKVEINLFRISEELIRNTLEHAEAQQIEIRIWKNGPELVLDYHDNGIGMDRDLLCFKCKGLGIQNIINRVEALNGKVNFEPLGQEGFNARVELHYN